MRSRTKITAVMAMVVLAACSENEGNGPVERPTSTAELRIAEPVPGAVVPEGEVLVRLELEGGRITSQVTTELEPDVGHVHVRLDGRTITLLGGLEERIPEVEPGQHVLEVEFVAADHGPFDPRVLATVVFTAE